MGKPPKTDAFSTSPPRSAAQKFAFAVIVTLRHHRAVQNEKNPVDTAIERRARPPFKRRPEILQRTVRNRPTGGGAGVDRGNDRKALPRRLL